MSSSIPSNPYASPDAAAEVAFPSTDAKLDARLHITRRRAYADCLRAYRILVDGKEVAKIDNGDVIQVPVTQGFHTIVARIAWSWVGSQTLEFDIQSGQTLKFDCTSNLRGLKFWFTIVYAFVGRTRWISLTQLTK